MHAALAECIFHVPHVICGVRMQPYTLWHAFLLDFCGSPFVGASSTGTPADLAVILEVCSRPPSCPAKAKVVQLQANKRLLRDVVKNGLRRTANEVRAYLDDYVAMPKCWESKASRSVKSHGCLYSVAVLMRHGRRTEAEAWATEFGYARHLVFALAEAGGNEIPIISAEEEAALVAAGHKI
jgi:hypothetical protein